MSVHQFTQSQYHKKNAFEKELQKSKSKESKTQASSTKMAQGKGSSHCNIVGFTMTESCLKIVAPMLRKVVKFIFCNAFLYLSLCHSLCHWEIVLQMKFGSAMAYTHKVLHI